VYGVVDPRFWVGFRDSGFEFLVSGFKFRVSGAPYSETRSPELPIS
jgi:hypothetical protein